ncbi:glycerol kinase GlpK [Corynebacterium alimapuense]|uniref:Glycerol kinase n=1 Tax=Corynebacterium alimapuense TaxID=1576874 RepID=A0A3M8KB28_9CORY|nr:glycerol kinase GlpK [Corynebacterium alimapuense]RNE50069.1 glycerol kinase [Corynebacterium alimapuense]
MQLNQYVAAIDQGTTSTRCILVDHAGRVVSSAQFEHSQIMPQQGWVEHDALEIWGNTRHAVSEALVDIDASPEDIVALGITNQRETAVVWDKATGLPIYHAIVWQDTRTADISGEDPARWLKRTGLLVNSYSAGPKIAWILDHVEGARERAAAGELLAGTMDTWLLWNLTGGALGDGDSPAVHATDVTNASRTLLMDLRTRQWDPQLCESLGVPMSILPTIRPSVGNFGRVRQRGTLAQIPLTGVLGDQQAAMFGQGCFDVGDAKNTYGTGLFLLLNTGTEPKYSRHGLLSTVLYEFEGQAPVYALEGSVAVGGSLVQWLRDQLGIIPNAAAIERLAGEVDDNGGVYIVPAFSGLFAPRWRPDARGVIVGLTRFADRRHIARAVLEATALQIREVVQAMAADSGIELTRLWVDGGMSANDLLMQLQADILGAEVVRPKIIETTAMGAAFAAGIGAGFWSGIDEVRALQSADRSWSPTWTPEQRDKLVEGWDRAVERSLDWAS